MCRLCGLWAVWCGEFIWPFAVDSQLDSYSRVELSRLTSCVHHHPDSIHSHNHPQRPTRCTSISLFLRFCFLLVVIYDRWIRRFINDSYEFELCVFATTPAYQISFHFAFGSPPAASMCWTNHTPVSNFQFYLNRIQFGRLHRLGGKSIFVNFDVESVEMWAFQFSK